MSMAQLDPFHSPFLTTPRPSSRGRFSATFAVMCFPSEKMLGMALPLLGSGAGKPGWWPRVGLCVALRPTFHFLYPGIPSYYSTTAMSGQCQVNVRSMAGQSQVNVRSLQDVCAAPGMVRPLADVFATGGGYAKRWRMRKCRMRRWRGGGRMSSPGSRPREGHRTRGGPLRWAAALGRRAGRVDWGWIGTCTGAHFLILSAAPYVSFLR